MADLLQDLEGALYGKVRRKANNTRKLRASAARVTREAPEVMVKITGFGKGAQHVKAHLQYISRNGAVDLETDRGERLSGNEQVKDLFSQWAEDFSVGRRRQNQRDTAHFVLSMPEGTEPEDVRDAVRDFARRHFGRNHEYVFALHTDEPHPHVHLTVKCRGFDGTQLNPKKADLQAWREGFADSLTELGVDAEATPRARRGVVRKPQRSVLRHMELGGKDRAPRVPKVKAQQIQEAAAELIAESKGQPPTPKPWDAAIAANQSAVKAAWLDVADQLSRPRKPVLYKKEPLNERPDYRNLAAGRVHAGTGGAIRADVRQPGIEKSGRRRPPESIASMRDVSRIPMAHDQRRSPLFLHADARDRVAHESQRTADIDVRRARAGDHGADRTATEGDKAAVREGVRRPTRDAGRLTSPASALTDRQLAEQVRAFIGGMSDPARIATRADLLRAELRQAFASAPTRAPVAAPTTKQQVTPQSATTGPDRGNDSGPEM